MKTQAPKSVTVLIAILLFLVGIIGIYIDRTLIGTDLAQLCLVISNILLILGVLFKGI
ncbi:MAG: hypothetical protein PVF58_08230 [Candidatus Methanofastidiosia archaeon]